MKVSELNGTALDWAVAKCEGRGIEFEDPRDPWLTCDGIADQPLHSYTPSTDWSQGGPIIEREFIAVWFSKGDWKSQRRDTSNKQHGPTPLIAAMRCYVSATIGEEVEIPENLK